MKLRWKKITAVMFVIIMVLSMVSDTAAIPIPSSCQLYTVAG